MYVFLFSKKSILCTYTLFLQVNRYWLMEYLSRQPAHRRIYQALVLRWHDYVSRTGQVRGKTTVQFIYLPIEYLLYL